MGCGGRGSRADDGALQQRDGRWCIVDLVGKHGRVRTVPMPTWVKGKRRVNRARAGAGFVLLTADSAAQA